jgi:hypothetical protein
MDWREAYVSFKGAAIGLLATAILMALLSAFMAAHPG